MFSDAQEVQDILQASGKFLEQIEEEELDIKEQHSGDEQKEADLDFHMPYYEKRDSNVFNAFEVSNNYDFVESKDHPIEEEVVILNFNVVDLQDQKLLVVYNDHLHSVFEEAKDKKDFGFYEQNIEFFYPPR
jgi:hypothetical protein